MYNRIIEFLNHFDILYQLQFGFRKHHSTDHALTYLINFFVTSIDQRKTTAGIFLDLSKAFDTLDHEILFVKLEHYGIGGPTLDWIKSYFSNRFQFVQFNNTCSSRQLVKCGAAQGSILGPLCFLTIYINDLPNVIRMAEVMLFAGDMSIFYSYTDPNTVASVMNQELIRSIYG